MITDEVNALSNTWKRALAVRQNLFKLNLKKVTKQHELDCKSFLQEHQVQKEKLLLESEKREKIKKTSFGRQRARSRSDEDLRCLNPLEKIPSFGNLTHCERGAHDFDGSSSTTELLRVKRHSRSEQDLRNLPASSQESVFRNQWEEDNNYILPKIQLRPPLYASSTNFSGPLTPPKSASPVTSPRMRKHACVKVPEVRRKISTERMEKLQPIGRNPPLPSPTPVIIKTDKVHSKSPPSRYVSSPCPVTSNKDSHAAASKRMSFAKVGLITVGSRSLDTPSPVARCRSSALEKGRGSLVRSESVPEMSHTNEHPISNLQVGKFEEIRAASAAGGFDMLVKHAVNEKLSNSYRQSGTFITQARAAMFE